MENIETTQEPKTEDSTQAGNSDALSSAEPTTHTSDAPEVSNNQTDASEPPTQPAPVFVSAPQMSAPPKQKFRKVKRLIVGLVVLAILAGGGYYGFAMYQRQQATKAFNQFTADVHNQEAEGAKRYVDIVNMSNKFSAMMNFNDPSQYQSQDYKDLTTSSLTNIKKQIDASCADKSDDMTKASIAKRFDGLSLSQTQRRYVSDMEKVTADLNKTEFSNTTACAEGPALVGFMQNISGLMPGLTVFIQMELTNADMPTDQQLATLKDYVDYNLVNRADMQKYLPVTTDFLDNAQLLLKDSYYTFDAVKRGDVPTAQNYASKVQSLAVKIGSGGNSVDKEMQDLGGKANDAVLSASQSEIAAIDYQKAHGANLKAMHLDYTIPSFRIADAVISNYSINHDNSFPHGKSIDDLAGMDKNVQNLGKKGLLKNLSYTSLGDDSSGFELKAKLPDGTVLDEKYSPTSETV